MNSSESNVLPFVKMHGIGNDYVFIDCFKNEVDRPSTLARAMSARHFGVGSDGLILIMPSRKANVRMRMFNADGSEAEMCGNGIRCLAKYAYEHGLARENPLTVETLAGIKRIVLDVVDETVQFATVDMGKPRLRRSEIPMLGPEVDSVIAEPLECNGERYEITAVSMGNPHCVIFTDSVDDVPLGIVGPRLETHSAFPERVNVHFAQVLSRGEARVRTWERGAGMTLACGTGASAVCVAGVLTDRMDRRTTIHLPGGSLDLRWKQDDTVAMTGRAEEVFTGLWPLEKAPRGEV